MTYSDFALKTMQLQHLLPGETPEDGFRRVAEAYGSNQDHKQRILKYLKRQWFIPATPVFANAGNEKGLPISCFLNYVDDSREGLGDHYVENIWLSSGGGGIGSYWGNVRPLGSTTSSGLKSTGIIPFLATHDAQTRAYQQGTSRRGAYAAYLDISHPEIEEFINMRKASGDPKRRMKTIHHGVNISDAFMEAVEADVDWKLVDPNSGETVKTVKAKYLWQLLMVTRLQEGEPYLHFIDTSNRELREELKNSGKAIYQSNLCSEIILPTSPERTAVCCLSSLNITKFDEWENDLLFLHDVMEYLDNVLEVFIQKAPSHLWRAVESAKNERSVGLGMVGFHQYLQSHMIPFESPLAVDFSERLAKLVNEKTLASSRILARQRGEPNDIKGSGERFSHRIAIAPNATTSIIVETSPSIEPRVSNAYKHKTDAGTFLVKNPELKKWLAELDMDNDDVWEDIITSGGSVQHLEIPDFIKDVFKTAFEIDQNWVIQHAAVRQPFIDQSQSLNLFFTPDNDPKYITAVHKGAWRAGLKTLYYCRSKAIRATEKVSQKIERTVREEYVDPPSSCNIDDDECKVCEG